MADWLEHYAKDLELDAWTSANVAKAVQDPETLKWTVSIEPVDGDESKRRTFVVNHIVFAVGIGGGTPKATEYPGLVRRKL